MTDTVTLKQALEALTDVRIELEVGIGETEKEQQYCEVNKSLLRPVNKAITALRTAIAQPDCRGCMNVTLPAQWSGATTRCFLDCTNGDKFTPLPSVRLYKVTTP